MSDAAGQAARQGLALAVSGAGRACHRIAQFALGLLILALASVAILAVRLAQGPMDVAWLARRIAESASSTAIAVTVDRAQLTWEGLHGGLDRPLDLVLRGVEVRDEDGRRQALVPRAAVSLVVLELLRGRVAFRTIELEGVRLKLLRTADGATKLDLGTPRPDAPAQPAASGGPSTLQTLTAPPPSERSRAPGLLSHLRRVRVHDTAIDIDDRQLGFAWSVPAIDVDLTRAEGGGASGMAKVQIALGAETLGLDARLALLPGGGLTVAGSLGQTNPSRLASLAPALAPLAALDAPLRLSGTATLDAGGGFLAATLKAEAEAGTVHVGAGTMPIRSAAVTAEATPAKLDLRVETLRLQPREEALPTTLTASVAATRAAGRVDARIVVDIDQVAFQDLPAVWPEGTGGPGTRPWITKNITAGTAHGGHAELSLTAPEDFSDATMLSLSGGIDGSDVTGHWLRPVPPIEHGEAHVVFVDPDTMDVFISSGRQADSRLALRPSKVRLTGLAGHDQFIAIQADLGGPFADVVTLLHHPKIKLLDKRPIPMQNPSGQTTAALTVNFPLKTDLDIDNVAIHAVGKLSQGHAGGIAVGRDLDRAMLDFDVNNDGLKIAGPADIAGLPSQLKVDMDFRQGPPSQVIERVGVTTTVTPKQIAGLGLNAEGVLTGAAALQLDYFARRDTTGDVRVTADLSRAGIAGGPVAWSKKEGVAGTLDAHVLLKAGKVATIERVHAEAPGLSVQMAADMAGGQPNLVRIQRMVVGETTDLTGDVRFPAKDGQPYVASLTGASLDVSRAFDRPAAKPSGARPSKGPPFSVDVKLAHVVAAGGRRLGNVAAHVENDGTITTFARLSATAGTGPVAISITPQRGGRRLAAEAQDAGALLRSLDVMETMSGGHLVVEGSYDDTAASHPLRGTAQISDVRIRDAPAIGRILQAMSLYGLVELARGPGLGFTRMVAPFRLEGDVVTLGDARAFSASLGVTAKGQIDLGRRTAEIEGTVIPAYFFNSLLGRVPLVGRLFSPEKDGGLFAATYGVHGSLDDPRIAVNPLAALTPGFLRGFFDIFDSPPAASQPARPPQGSAEQQR